MPTLLQSLSQFVSNACLEGCPKKEVYWAKLALTGKRCFSLIPLALRKAIEQELKKEHE